MIKINVTDQDIIYAKEQIIEFEKTRSGKYRYQNVKSYRGIICEMLTSNYLNKYFNVSVKATGLVYKGNELDDIDDFDMVINGKKVEIKAATKNHFNYIMPKVYCVNNKPKDIYIGCKYNETVQPNEVQIIGFMYKKDIIKYPIKKNKGASYYEIPLKDLRPLNIDKRIKEIKAVNYINNLKWYKNIFYTKSREVEFWEDICNFYKIELNADLKNAFDYIKINNL